jgi:TolA-binding protein
MIRLAFLALVVLSFWGGPARAGEEAVLITETVQLRVADGFMAEQEYYRAITEYKRFLFLFPYSDQGDYALLRVGTAYLRGEEHDRAVRSLQELREKFPSSPLVTQSRYLEGLAAWKGKKAKQARSLFETLAQDDPGSDYAPRALAAKALIQLEEDDPQGAGQTLDLFLRVYPDHARAEQVREAGRLLVEYQTQPQKSEVLAGVLSGILPGAGYAYAGEFATGFMSLGVNGVFIAATWTAFAHGLEALGVLAGGVGLPFYIGNIYGSALAARKWNQAVKIQARAPILATLDFVFE